MLKQWELIRARSGVFNLVAGRKVTDSVWRLACRCEASVAEREHCGAVFWDLRKCYAHLCHLRLGKLAQELQFPIVMLRLGLGTYRWARHLRLDGMLAPGLFPTRGIISGAAGATCELKAYMYKAVSKHIAEHMHVCLSIHVDDISQDAHDGDQQVLIKDLRNSAKDLEDIFQGELGLPLAANKMVVVGSPKAVVDEFKASAGWLAGRKAFSEKVLGVDFAAGKCCKERDRWFAGTGWLRRRGGARDWPG